MLCISTEELANFAECEVSDIENAMEMGFHFKTLADAQYLFSDKRVLKNSVSQYKAFKKWQKEKKENKSNK